MAEVTEAREQLIEAMKNAYVSAQTYFPDNPIEALVVAMLDSPETVLRALGGVREHLGMGNYVWQFPGVDYPKES